jgi:hypothetical protein
MCVVDGMFHVCLMNFDWSFSWGADEKSPHLVVSILGIVSVRDWTGRSKKTVQPKKPDEKTDEKNRARKPRKNRAVKKPRVPVQETGDARKNLTEALRIF